jgi:hypothetical protein
MPVVETALSIPCRPDFVWSSAGFAALAENHTRSTERSIVTDYAKDDGVLPPTGESVAKSISRFFASASMSQTDFVYICVDPDFEMEPTMKSTRRSGQHSRASEVGSSVPPFSKIVILSRSPHTWIIDMVTRLVDAFAHPRIEDNRHVETMTSIEATAMKS